MITDVFFDLDGTLTNPMTGITKSVQYALKSFGINVKDNRELTFFIGPPLGETFMKYYGFSEKQAERAVEKYREYFAPTGIFENEVYPGTEHMLSSLKDAGKRLFIATGKPTVFSKKILEHFGLDGYFTDVYGIGMSELHKTKAETLNALMTDYNACKENSVMVGDRIFDIDAGKKCGIKTVGVSFGFAEKGELEKGADHIVKNTAELEALLMKI